MEKVKQLCYTKDINEVPGKAKTLFKKNSGRDIDGFISAVWDDKKEVNFLIITSKAVFDNSAGKFEEILTSTINGVNNVLALEILNQSGVKYVPFKSTTVPEQIRNYLEKDIKGAIPKKSNLLG